MELDLFSFVQQRIGCQFISDLRLPLYLPLTQRIMSKIPLDRFSLLELSDMAHYLYGVKVTFHDVSEAKLFFIEQYKPIKKKCKWQIRFLRILLYLQNVKTALIYPK